MNGILNVPVVNSANSNMAERHPRLNRPALFTLLTSLVLVMWGCNLFPGGGDSDPEPVLPVPGGELRIATIAPDSLDPPKASSRTALLVAGAICDPLVTAHPVTGELSPGVAESWELAPDATKVTLHLGPSSFHNGRAVVAADFVYSLARFIKKDVGSPRDFFLLDKIAGYLDVREGRADALAGVKAIDEKTLEITLSEPFAEILAVLSHPVAGSPLPQEEVAKGPEVYAAMPVCNGPYRVSEPWMAGTDLKLEQFADYLGKSDAYTEGGQGYVATIVLKFAENPVKAYEMVTNKVRAADIADVPIEQLSQARGVEARVSSGTSGVVSFIGLPVTKPPFDNADFRRALALAVDRREIVEKLLAGSRQVADGFLPASAGPVAAGEDCSTIAPEADSDGAAEALEISGIDPASVSLKLYLNPGSGHEQWLEIVARQWKETLGINVELTPRGEGFAGFVDYLVEGPDSSFRWAWLVNYASPESLYSPNFVGGSLDNYARFANASFDELVKKARATVDDDARVAAYLEAAKVLCTELPMIPIWFAQEHVAFAPTVVSAIEERVDIFGNPILRELGLGP